MSHINMFQTVHWLECWGLELKDFCMNYKMN